MLRTTDSNSRQRRKAEQRLGRLAERVMAAHEAAVERLGQHLLCEATLVAVDRSSPLPAPFEPRADVGDGAVKAQREPLARRHAPGRGGLVAEQLVAVEAKERRGQRLDHLRRGVLRAP